MKVFDSELILNHITGGECMPPFHKNYEEYKKMAYMFLNHKGKHLFAEDILSRYNKGITLEQLFEQQSDRFIQGSNREKDGIHQKTWYDVWSMEEVEKGDDFFDYFFACKLRHLSLLDIDELLDFHLDYSFKNNNKEFNRFLQLTLRQYQESLLNAHIVDTVNEWMKANEAVKNNNEVLSGPNKDDRIKGRMLREAGDKLTSLNQVQTALLIQYMQKAGILLKDDYLTYTQAGKAFNILTGYSAHTLRQQLGTKGALVGVKHEDYKELHAVITQLEAMIKLDVH